MGMYLAPVTKRAGAVNGAARRPRKLPETRLRWRPMFVRNPSASLTRWGRTSLLVALLGLPLYASCTKSEDTEPFVPATQGAQQPGAEGALISEDDACERVRAAYAKAYDDLGCNFAEPPECPVFIRPGAGAGCFEYYEGSVAACEQAYGDVSSCSAFPLCVVSAKRNDALPTCVMVETGTGGAGGQGPDAAGGAAQGGAPTFVEGGAPMTMGGVGPSDGGAADAPAGGTGG